MESDRVGQVYVSNIPLTPTKTAIVLLLPKIKKDFRRFSEFRLSKWQCFLLYDSQMAPSVVSTIIT